MTDNTTRTIPLSADTDTSTIIDLIEVLNDGMKFYEEAAQQVERQDLRSLFQNMANHKKQVIQDLTSVVSSMGDTPGSSGTFAGSMRKLYAEMRANISSNKNHEYVAQLEEFEDRILHAFEKAATESNDEGIRQIVDKHIKAVRDDHDFIRTLKKRHV